MITITEERIQAAAKVWDEFRDAGKQVTLRTIITEMLKAAGNVPVAPREPTHMAVIVEGGLVTAIVSNDPTEIDREILIVDYDTDGVDDVDTIEIGTDRACVRTELVVEAEIDLNSIASHED